MEQDQDAEQHVAAMEATIARLNMKLAGAQADTMKARQLLEQQASNFKERMERLLATVGKATTCRRCSAVIFDVPTHNGKLMPITRDSGLPHFADCRNKGAK